ncbi:hypothetical protein BH10PAT3_BH10PAT3_5210 [soil metagenome]
MYNYYMVRSYQDTDYDMVKTLYEHTEWYGGSFDERRDGREALKRKIAADPEAIFVFEQDGQLLGTISIIEDGRVAWLYRFVDRDNNPDVAKALYGAATDVLRARGHQEVLVYSDPSRPEIAERYKALGMVAGGEYTCFYSSLN